MKNLTSTQSKLKNGWCMENLPINVQDPLWNDVKIDCNMSGPELSLLKNELQIGRAVGGISKL